MIKSKLDFKLINIALIAVICYFVYQSSGLWLNVLDKIISIILPLFLGFALAYAFYPILKYLEKYKIPRLFGIFLVLFVIILIFITIIISIIPILSNQIISLIDNIIIFIKNLTLNFDSEFLNKIISELGIYVSNGVFKTINLSINLLSNLVIIISSFVYFLLDMDKIRDGFKEYLKVKSIKFYRYFKLIDLEMQKYILGFLRIAFISFFEYTIVYYIIGHPNALLLGILSSLSNFIPYFGGIIVQVIAVATGLVISKYLGLKVFIITLLFGLFDSYVLNPLVYGKTNELHPIIVISSVFAGGILFGTIGVIISLPISIIIISSFKFLKGE